MNLSRIKKIDGKIDSTHQTLGDSPNTLVNFQAIYNDMKFLIVTASNEHDENKRLREALGFYADDENWEQSVEMPFEKGDYCSEVDLDKGKIARQALEGDSK